MIIACMVPRGLSGKAPHPLLAGRAAGDTIPQGQALREALRLPRQGALPLRPATPIQATATPFPPPGQGNHPEGNAGKSTLEKATLLLPGMDTPQEFTLEIRNGLVFIFGDVLLFTEEAFRLKQMEKGGIIVFNILRWPGGQIPYVVSTAHPAYSDIVAAINHINSNTNICMVPRTNQADYVEFVYKDANACYSNIGRVGGRQEINLDNCGFGAAVHEIAHAAGMWHEHSRNDRDSFVVVNYANIEAGKASQFDKYGTLGANIGSYDYSSIMHYPTWAFSKNGLPTLQVKMPPGTPSTVIGLRTGLSAGDIASLNGMYPTKNCGAVVVADTSPVIALTAPLSLSPPHS